MLGIFTSTALNVTIFSGSTFCTSRPSSYLGTLICCQKTKCQFFFLAQPAPSPIRIESPLNCIKATPFVRLNILFYAPS